MTLIAAESIKKIFHIYDSTWMSRYTFGHGEAFCLSKSFPFIPLDVTTSRDSYSWNYRELATLLTMSASLAGGTRTTSRDSYSRNYSELATLLTMSVSLAEGGLEQLTIGSMRKNLTTELY